MKHEKGRYFQYYSQSTKSRFKWNGLNIEECQYVVIVLIIMTFKCTKQMYHVSYKYHVNV